MAHIDMSKLHLQLNSLVPVVPLIAVMGLVVAFRLLLLLHAKLYLPLDRPISKTLSISSCILQKPDNYGR